MGQNKINPPAADRIIEKKKKNISQQEIPLASTLVVYNSIRTVVKIILSSATIVAFYAVAEHLGIDKHLWVQDVQFRVFSTLGQPNWLAAYIVVLLPISMVFVVSNSLLSLQGRFISLWNLAKHALWLGITTLFFMVLLYTRSRSGLLAFAVSDILFWPSLSREGVW